MALLVGPLALGGGAVLEGVIAGTLRGNPCAAQSAAKSMPIQSDPPRGGSLYACTNTREAWGKAEETQLFSAI